MKRYVPRLLPYLLVGALSACIDAFDPARPLDPPRLVVDGSLTDQPGPHRLRLSYDAPFNNSDVIFTRLPETATVWASDDRGGRIDYTLLSRGNYQTTPDARGLAGRTYTLHIRFGDGREYLSKPETLRAAPPIDTVYTEYRRLTGAAVRGEFQVFLNVTAPTTPGDFYRWTWTHYNRLDMCLYQSDLSQRPPHKKFVCCEPCWAINTSTGDINIASDALSNGRTLRRQPITTIPFDSTSRYYLLVEQQLLPKSVYQFWQRAVEQTQNTGGLFDRPAAPVLGNLYNPADANEQVLGLFSVAGATRKIIYLRRDQTGDVPFPPARLLPYVLQDICFACQESLVRTALRPPGWRD